MERLEAALEKARASRRNLQTQAAVASGGTSAPVKRSAETAELWHNLKEIKISALAARRTRITALNTGPGSGPYDLLRSRVLRLMQENGWSSVAVTSPNPACGKTTVSANLAFSLARQSDLKIMVLDLDLRRPSLHEVLSHKPNNSFHEVLEGKVRAEDNLVRFGDNLVFGLNARSAKRPSELLQSKMTREKIDQLRQTYKPDLVIFDLPPMLATDDNIGFLPSVDCGILVNAAESTTMAQLDSCEKEMAELTNVLGVVLNKCRFNDSETGYDGDYY